MPPHLLNYPRLESVLTLNSEASSVTSCVACYPLGHASTHVKTVGTWDLKVRLCWGRSALCEETLYYVKFEFRHQEIYGYRLVVLVC